MVGMWYLHLKIGKGVLYEEGEQSSSDSEVIVTDTTQFFDGNDTPFVISKGCILEVMHLFLLHSFLSLCIILSAIKLFMLSQF